MQCTTNARMAGSGCAASVCYNRDFPATSLMATERLKRAIILAFCAGALAILPSCGGGNSNSSSAPQVSKIKKRAFVTNNFANQIEILNAANDTVNTTFVTSTNGTTTQSPTNLISAGTNPAQMVVTSDKKLTLVFDQGSNVIAIINNATESNTAQIPLPAFTESFVAAPDSTTVYVAVPNAPISGQPSGALEILNATAGTLTNTIAIPGVRRVVLSHNGNKLLAFADGVDQMFAIDTSAKTVTTISGFDRPVYAVFSSDDSKAYILNCGAECGGAAAKITVLDMATNTPGASAFVTAARVGVLDSSGNLYVAGTTNTGGKLDVLNAGSLSISKSAVAISDGTQSLMALAANNKLFIGSRGCSSSVQGCLSIFDTATGSVVISAPGAGDVTGMDPVAGRSVVYVVEGGELVIYDTTTSKPQATQIDIVGKAFDVKVVDQ